MHQNLLLAPCYFSYGEDDIVNNAGVPDQSHLCNTHIHTNITNTSNAFTKDSKNTFVSIQLITLHYIKPPLRVSPQGKE